MENHFARIVAQLGLSYLIVSSILIALLILAMILMVRRYIQKLERKNHDLEILGQFDGMTGALSRLEIFRLIDYEIDRSFRSNSPFVLLELDIDHFKCVNDLYGHSAGDLVLTNLVKVCLDAVRRVDAVGRIGGEEFLILMPRTNKVQGFAGAERVRLAIESTRCRAGNFTDIGITVSIGLAEFDPLVHRDTNTFNLRLKLLEQVDRAMYAAKDAGRNKTVMHN